MFVFDDPFERSSYHLVDAAVFLYMNLCADVRFTRAILSLHVKNSQKDKRKSAFGPVMLCKDTSVSLQFPKVFLALDTFYAHLLKNISAILIIDRHSSVSLSAADLFIANMKNLCSPVKPCTKKQFAQDNV